jgi:long-chain acyl-CoA synthetase
MSLEPSIQWLHDRMAEIPACTAMIWRQQRVTYAHLIDLVARARATLDDWGISRGEISSLEGDFSPGAVAMLLALIDRAAVVVPMTAAVPPHQRQEFLDIAEVQARIEVDTEDSWRVEKRPVVPSNPITHRLLESGSPGLVLYSSGSTGRSKAALHNLTALLEKFKARRPPLRSLTFLLLDHIGGQNTLYYLLSSGGTIVAIDRRDPDTVAAAIAEHKVELLPTSPTFLNLLLISEAWKRHDLSSLKRVTYGTEVMPESTLARLHDVLPTAELLQTYGLSELGILRSKSRDSSSLWLKVGGEGFETKVVEGILWIRAQSAMLGYLNHPSPFDADGWFNTGDMVEVDGEWIRILGRQSEIINVGGQKVYPAEVESVLLQLPGVRDVSVCGERSVITGNIVVARFNLDNNEPLSELKRRVRDFCRGRLEPFKSPARIEIVSGDQFSARFKKMRATGEHVRPPSC